MFVYRYKENSGKIKTRKTFIKGSWIDCVNLNEEDELKISKKFNIDIGLLEDSKDLYEVPRVEKDENILYIYLRYPAPKKNDYKLATYPILVALGKDFILTSYGKLNSEPYFINQLRNSKDENFSTVDKKDFLIKILEFINLKYERGFRKINREILFQKSRISKITDEELERFVELESVVNEFLNALVPMVEELEKLIKTSRFLRTSEEEDDKLEDIILAQRQLIGNGRNIVKMIRNIREAFSIIATNRLNKTVTNLTLITLVLTIPTLIGSFFGMNVPNGFESDDSIFHLIIVGSILMSFLTYWLFRFFNKI